MYVTLMQMLLLIGGISAAYWAGLAGVMKLSPGAAARAGLANVAIVFGVWLSFWEYGHLNFVNCQLSDWLILGGIALFRACVNHLGNRHYRTPLLAWLPLGLEVLLTVAVHPGPETQPWRTVVWSLAASWVSWATYLESYRVVGQAGFNLGARLAVCWPFLVGGTALLYRAAGTLVNAALQNKSLVEQGRAEDVFIWCMVALLLILNYTLGMLACARLILRIRNLADRDFLTGCLNRRSMEARLEMDIDRNRRFGAPLSCILFDLDHFKHINDRYGHDAGDAALKHVAQIAQGALRAVDALGRFGGEEFLVLLPGTPLAGALESAHRMQQLFAEHPLQHGGQQIAVTASFGVATLQADEVPEGFIKRSDAAMYRAKQGGRNRVESA